ncbi:hypothetical protein [Pseudomonas sp. PS01301]|nr:hypothetical protein [Pseudomonas sp. PS01301]
MRVKSNSAVKLAAPFCLKLTNRQFPEKDFIANKQYLINYQGGAV